jgi:hypothetical protein
MRAYLTTFVAAMLLTMPVAAEEPTLFVAELATELTAVDGDSPGHDVAVIESFAGAERSYAVFSAADEPVLRSYLDERGIRPTKISHVEFINSPVLGGGPEAGATPRQGHQVYVIERPIPGVGSFPLEQKKKISMGSNAAVDKLGTVVEWDHSYLTSEGTFCVYRAVDEATIREHAEFAGAPIAMITPVTHALHGEAD